MRKILASVILTVVLLSAAQAFAEGYFDVYAGGSFLDTAKITLSSNVANTSGEVKFKSDATYGVRGGYWLRKLPWLGFGGDLSSLHARGNKTKFDIIPITPMAMFRLPLFVEPEMPQGILQPYIGIGPSVSLYTYAQADFGQPISGFSGTGSLGSAVGFQLPVGFAVQLSKRVALFSEYRYAFYKVDVDQDYVSQIIGSTWNSDNVARNLKTNLSMHNVLMGMSFRF